MLVVETAMLLVAMVRDGRAERRDETVAGAAVAAVGVEESGGMLGGRAMRWVVEGEILAKGEEA